MNESNLQDRIAYLLQRIQEGVATEQELLELTEMIRNDETGFIAGQVEGPLKAAGHDWVYDRAQWDAVAPSILQTDKTGEAGEEKKGGKLVHFRRFAAAAAVLLLLGVSSYFLFFDNKKTMEPRAEASRAEEIVPGREGAILTLANGKQIVLDGAADGKLTEAAEKKGAQVVYDGENGVVETNTMTTPKGRQYSLVLADGTKVWLNAGSSITFPTAFIKNNREVSITGEVYFEVTKDPKKPFKVQVNDQTAIEVLGTSFNVKGYLDEPGISTTLLEGSVRVSAFQRSQILKPGQQSEVKPDERTMQVRNADVEKVMAWKNGFFNFQDVPLPEAMKQLERWYDIEVVYEKGIPDIRLGGKLSNDVSLSGLLKSLEESELHFRMEGRKLIVLP